VTLGWIDEESAKRCDDSLPRGEDRDGSRPALLPWLGEVWQAWHFFGPATVVLDGLAAAVVDDSHKLYSPRLEWLHEHGHTTETARGFHLACWRALDSEHFELMQAAVERARERAKNEAG
jgi:hypothetical protein